MGAERSRQIGVGLSYLLFRPPEWIHRRVEGIVFIDEVTVRRRTSIDFTYPLWAPSVSRMRSLIPNEPALVPLSMLEKERLANFSVEDESGRPLPLLTTTQNSAEAARVLIGVARTLRRRAHKNLPGEISQALTEIAGLPWKEARFLTYVLRRLHKQSNAASASSRVEEVINLFGAHAPAQLHPLARSLAPHHRPVSALLGNEPFRRLVEELTFQFLMLVPLESSSLSRRRILKFSYDQTLRHDANKALPTRLQEAALEGCSYKGRSYQFEGMRAGHAESTHLEIVAPSDIEITKASFVAQNPRDKKDFKSDRFGFAKEMAPLQLREVPRNWPGTGLVMFQASRVGVLRAGPALAVLVALVLFAGSQRTGSITPEAGAAILLAVPTLVAAFLVRPGEHRLSTRLLFGVRLLVLGSGLCSFAAAGALAGGWTGQHRLHIWRGCFIVSVVFALLLILAWALTALRRHTNIQRPSETGPML